MGVVPDHDTRTLKVWRTVNEETSMKPHTLSAIVAIDLNGAIGHRGDLLCHLPADLAHFKRLTLGRAVVMGRTTFESLPRGPLPSRQNIVITRRRDYRPWGAVPVASIGQALQVATAEPVIIGGGQIYQQSFELLTTIHLTRIHARFPEADTFFPEIDPGVWEEVELERHTADGRNPFDYDFITLRRR